jgi:formate/nitrite transporter
MAYVSRKITLEQLLRNWSIVFAGNLIGSLAIVFLILFTGQWSAAGAMVGVKTLMIANSKVNLTFCQALSRGILCNMLVCLAVWLCFSGRSVTDKILAIIFPITAFVALGFEHSVANMYFIPAGLLGRQSQQVLAATQSALGSLPDLSRLTISGFFLYNLLPVTIGNIVGGSIFVASIYWFVYLRRSAAQPLRRCMTSGPPMVSLGSTVAEAVKVMKEYTTGSVLVGNKERAVGILSEEDIVYKVVGQNKKPASVKVEDVMSSPLVSVDINRPVYEIYRTMAEHHIRHLLVTDSEKRVGFVSVRDLLKNPII